MHSGVSMVRGGLRGRGIIVPHQRVIDSIHRVEPSNSKKSGYLPASILCSFS